MSTVSAGSHALAHGLRGFRTSTLRVRVERVEGTYVWVRTADLLDAGTPLVLDAGQLSPAPATGVVGYVHRDGLVVFV